MTPEKFSTTRVVDQVSLSFLMPHDEGTVANEIPCAKPVAAPARQNEYYPLSDWLRIGLATVVVLYHVRLLKCPPSGNLAVQVFSL
jgi:hypothetical protein